MDTIRLLLLFFTVCFLFFPMISGNTTSTSRGADDIEPQLQTQIAADDNLLAIGLTDSTSAFATGNVSSYRGFAYPDDSDDVLRFVDPISQVTLNQTLPTGTIYDDTIAGSDIDGDGSTEFLIMSYNGTAMNLYAVDFNDDQTTVYNCSIDTPDRIDFGDFNGDSAQDVLVISRYNILTLDLLTGSVIGNLTVSPDDFGIDCFAVGRFMEQDQDSIAFGFVELEFPNKVANFSIIAGNASVLRTMEPHSQAYGVTNFEYGTGLDEVAFTTVDGHMTALEPTTMSLIFNITHIPKQSFVSTGFFNQDEQQDLIAVAEYSNYTVSINGTDGSLIHQSVVVNGANKIDIAGDPPGAFYDLGDIDSDNLTDIAISVKVGSSPGDYSPCFVRGIDGTAGYIETEIEKEPDFIRAYDVSGNSKDDMIVLQDTTIYIILSDVDAPVINPEPLNPLHPTILDPYIEVEVLIDEMTEILQADIFLRQTGANWSQPIDEMQVSGNQYFAFLVGLAEGDYEYYLQFQDTYLNIGTLGNETHPLNFTIEGHLSWSYNKNQNDDFEYHLMDMGNTSDGSELIYILDGNDTTVVLESYTPDGDNQTLSTITAGIEYNYWVYTGLLDGDNVLDPVVVLWNGLTYDVNVSVFHGASGTHWFMNQYPGGNLSKPQSTTLFDCDADGIDELFFVAENRSNPYESVFVRMHTNGSWSEVRNQESNHAESYMLSIAKTTEDSTADACVTASYGIISIFNATSMKLISSHNITHPDYTWTVGWTSDTFTNGSEQYPKFIQSFVLVNSSDYSMGFYIFDASTSRINETNLYILEENVLRTLIFQDIDDDGTDEAVGGDYFSGDLLRFEFTDQIIIDWTQPITNADILNTEIVDFDGDGEDEVCVFSDQDETLNVVSFNGVVERTIVVGKAHGTMPLSDVDIGFGDEIVVYPLVQDQVTKIGVIRDIVQIRRMNVTFSYAPTDLLQGDTLAVNATVENIYAEVVEEASVLMTIHYLSGNTVINQTKALIFGADKYSTAVAVNWPIGIINLSLSVEHVLYLPWDDYYPDALTVRSDLDVALYAKETVLQDSPLLANITVTDSLGTRVSDATVTVTIADTDYSAAFEDTQYRLSVPSVDLAPGIHQINATVSHPYATGTSNEIVSFRLETDNLNVNRGIPTLVEQDDEFSGWLNITDLHSNPIESAYVAIISGSYEFALIEMEPGCYFLDSSVEMSVGNHTFKVFIEHEFIRGTDYGEFNVIVMGSLLPEVPDVPPVEGGELFNVTVFINDVYGTTPDDTWVIVEIDGENVTASHLSGSRFVAELNASYAIGNWNFTVYYGSEFSHPGKHIYNLEVNSDPSFVISSSQGWEIYQGEGTTIDVDLEDWRGLPVQDASVTVLVRGTTYVLDYVSDGQYQKDISTVGWAYGEHTYYLTISHDNLHLLRTSDNITVIADPKVSISLSSQSPTQYSVLEVRIDVTDQYDNPISELQVTVDFAGMTEIAEETDVRGTYVAAFSIGSTSHGTKNITVNLDGEHSDSTTSHAEVTVMVFIPSLEALGGFQISMAAGLSLVISLIGMILYLKVASVISTSPRKTEDVTRGIRRLDSIYLTIVAISGAIFVHSWFLAEGGQHMYALLEAIILLGSSVLLYGLWLYRDAYSSILQTGRISKRRVALGVWHLLLVPFVVLMIFEYGSYNEIFQYYILEAPAIVFGEIRIVPLLATILATYMSSIVIVVVSFYREIRKGLMRIEDMQAAGTPQNVIDEEQSLLISRTGSSIRIKFLMFLLILGATTIMQLEFLRNYSMAAIVLLPVVFLVLIPFVSSRLIKAVQRVARREKQDEAEMVEILAEDVSPTTEVSDGE